MYKLTTLLTLTACLTPALATPAPAAEAIAVAEPAIVERAAAPVPLFDLIEDDVKLEARDPKKKKKSSNNNNNSTNSTSNDAASDMIADRRNAIGVAVIVGGVAVAMGMM